MMSLVADKVRRALGIELPEVAGSIFAGEIPMSNALVNRLIAERLAGAQLPIAAVRMEAHDGDRLTIVLSMRGSLIPDVTIAAKIEEQPHFPNPAVLWLRWTLPAMRALSFVAAPALAYFKKLPPGIRVEGDRIAVDLAELLRSRGLGELMDYITRVNVTTREGAIIVAFALRVP
jgi:hypothetical protein